MLARISVVVGYTTGTGVDMLFRLWHSDGTVKYVRITWSDESGLDANLQLLLDTDDDLHGLSPQQRVALASSLIMECNDED